MVRPTKIWIQDAFEAACTKLAAFLPARLDRSWLVILILPLILIVLDDKWIFTPLGFIDGWIYYWYFHFFPELLKSFPGLYFGTRLSAILPGYVLYHIFDPLVADYVLHLAMYYVATSALYVTLKNIFDRHIALLTTIVMGCYTYFLASTGWDYVDGAGIVYFLITVMCLTLAAKASPWRLWLLAAGLSYAALIYSNIYWLTLAPLLPIYYLLANRLYRKNALLLSSAIFIAGGLILTLIFGVVTYFINGNFLFFAPSFNFATSFLGKGNLSVATSYLWLTQASWLSFPVLLLLTSVIVLIRSRLRQIEHENPFVVYFCLLYVFASFIFIGLQIIGRQSILQDSFYTSYLIPFMFLAFASQLATYLKEMNSRQFFTLAAGTLIIMIVPFAFSSTIKNAFQFWHFFSIVPPILLGLFGFIAVARAVEPIKIALVLFLSLSLGNVLIYPEVSINNSANSNRASFATVVHGMSVMNAVAPPTELYVWYQLDEPLNKVYTTLASMQLGTFVYVAPSHVSDNFPSLTSLRVGFDAPLAVGTKVAILSADEHALDEAIKTLKHSGLGARFLSQNDISQGDIRFRIIFIEVISLNNVTTISTRMQSRQVLPH
jgi:hypothetical protein